MYAAWITRTAIHLVVLFQEQQDHIADDFIRRLRTINTCSNRWWTFRLDLITLWGFGWKYGGSLWIAVNVRPSDLTKLWRRQTLTGLTATFSTYANRRCGRCTHLTYTAQPAGLAGTRTRARSPFYAMPETMLETSSWSADHGTTPSAPIKLKNNDIRDRNHFTLEHGNMTAQNVSGEEPWSEDLLSEEEDKDEGLRNSHVYNKHKMFKKSHAAMLPPIDIARCSKHNAIQDECTTSSSSGSEHLVFEGLQDGDPISPNSTVSSRGIASPPITSPTSTTSPNGGIVRGRKSSIKDSSKTPETPGRKSVRFADALGLDLEVVRNILESESPPDYPSMALAACSTVFTDDETGGSTVTIQPRYLSMSFIQPGGQSDFLTRVYQQQICLENAVVSDFTVLGTIKVRNISYQKSVKIRYSADRWKTFGDIPALYVLNSCDGPTDRYSFGLSAPRDMSVGDRLEFCICYRVNNNQEFWDNNFGQNYSLLCHAHGDTVDDENKALWTLFRNS